MSFTEEQIERYSRHIILQEIGEEGQKKIFDSKILVVGLGGLGNPACLYLAAAGIGTLGILDSDAVELSNLNRQILHTTEDIGKDKVISTKEKINKLNKDVKVITHKTKFTVDNAMEIIKDYDFVIDGSDNFSTKFLINDACVLLDKPFSHAGVLRFDGQSITVIPNKTPCYRCIFPDMPPRDVIPTSQQAGVLGVVPGVLGTIQALEALKFVLGKGDLLTGRLFVFDALKLTVRIIEIKKNENCKICGNGPEILRLESKNYIEKVLYCSPET
ncbi:MAG: HesA/MoeB/ThiF family protein [Candidatus Hydrogenedentota bacterium]